MSEADTPFFLLPTIQPLVDIETDDGDSEPAGDAPKAAAAGSAASQPAAASSAATGTAPCAEGSGFVEFDKSLATPAVRRIARENNININQGE